LNNADNILYQCYAGAGKTYDIVNRLIPSLESKYIVLTPSNESLSAYRDTKINDEKINCAVIQTYTLSNTIPDEPIVIVDEFGMMDTPAHDMLLKCAMLGKQIICYGDFNQLPPPGEISTINAPNYLKMLFGQHKSLDTNMRNDFTKEYYDSLINHKVNLINEVKKHSAKTPEEASYIICYRNSTVDKYNKIILEHKGLDAIDEGVELICTVNSQRLQKLEIYNRTVLTIEENKSNKHIRLSNGEVFTKADIKKYFKPAYARTLYGIQGKSIESYYYAPEDYKFLTPRAAYTVISRIKTK
jgi:hypothetical protein